MQSERNVNADFDVVVIGGGIVGLCTTWFLAEEGVAVICLDDGRSSASIANAGSLHVQLQSRLMQLFPERLPDYEKSLSMYPRAVQFWLETAPRLDADIDLRVTGGLMVAETDAQVQQLAQKSAVERKHGIESEILGQDELRRLAPYLAGSVVGAAHCMQEGKVDPLLANDAVRRSALRAGGVVRRARVERIEPERRAYIVNCENGVFRTDRIAIAAGAGSGALAAPLGLELPAKAEPLHMNITEPVSAFMPHLIQHAERPITLKQLKNGQLLIGGGWPAELAEERGHPRVLAGSLHGNLALAGDLVPQLADVPLLRTWAGPNPLVDLLSVLGQCGPHAGIYAAIPGDAGYTLGPYCARLLVDLMLGRTPDFPLGDLSPSRF